LAQTLGTSQVPIVLAAGRMKTPLPGQARVNTLTQSDCFALILLILVSTDVQAFGLFFLFGGGGLFFALKRTHPFRSSLWSLDGLFGLNSKLITTFSMGNKDVGLTGLPTAAPAAPTPGSLRFADVG
jgi:hypothetical protein